MEAIVNRSESVIVVDVEGGTMLDEDNRSSSLSDLGDGGANDELDDEHQGPINDSDGNDTEAETERLEDSPQKFREHTGVVLSLSACADEIGSSPPATLEPINENEVIDQLYSTRDNIGVIPKVLEPQMLNGDGDQVSDISSLEGSTGELSKVASPPAIAGKKRKRPSPPTFDGSEHRVTSPILASQKRLSEDNLAAQPTNHTEEAPKASPTNDDDCNTMVGNRLLSDVGEDEGVTQQLVASKAQRSKRGKRKGKKVKEDEIGKSQLSKGPLDIPEDGVEELNGTDVVYNHDEAMELDDGHEDAEAEAAAKNEDEFVRKKAAMDLLGDIERQFATFKDKLYDERLAQVDEELASLAQPLCLHPGYLVMRKCLDERRDEKIHHEQMLMKYELEALQRRSIAEKAQHHGQYMQTVRDLRDRELWRAGEEWYQIQRERRSWEGNVPDCTYTFTTRRSQQITQQIAYNTEVSLISGIAKHVGFPAAPEIGGARTTEVDDDFHSMGIKESIRPPQPNAAPPVRITLSASASLSRLQPAAEEQFLEQNPWANAQHPAHQIYQHPQRQIYSLSGPPSPVSSPAAQRRITDVNVSNGSASTNAEQYSFPTSSIGPTPYTGDKGRVFSLPNRTPDNEGAVLYTPSKLAATGIKSNASERAVANSPPEQGHKIVAAGSRPGTFSNSPPYQARKSSTTEQETLGKRAASSIGPSPFRYSTVKAEDPLDSSHHSPNSAHFHIPARTGITNGVESGRFGAR
ncbi:MAG: transcriptional regulatory DEP1 [Lasallia pustulata]|uniref:Transcriptional regulatory DEP1 n=1 Tax=Lasallia pustulata TaxID=136370 RepID=A0A5M8PJV7_9LECA|nr:MAG: transcriptional regulatory DEP1 [Lasallia pustulata]